MERKKKAKKICFSILAFIIIITVTFCVLLDKAADEYAYSDVRNALYSRINEIFVSNLSKHSDAIDGAFITQKENGDVRNVTVEAYKLDLFISDMINDTAICLDGSHDSFSFPVGNVFGIKLLSGRGPRIPFRVIPLGHVSASIDSEVTSSGINQSLYRVVLRINALAKLMSPFGGSEIEIKIEYALCEILIIGKVPDVYFNRDATP